jgi:trehalose 6-phosphate synthase/phosphatase
MSTCGWLSDRESGASDWDQGRLDNWWNAYKGVNAEFMNVLTGLVRNGDILITISLCSLPEHLTAWEMETFGRRVTRKVFRAFPFRPVRSFGNSSAEKRYCEGMLHADVVGFHAFDHASTLNAAKRILGLITKVRRVV